MGFNVGVEAGQILVIGVALLIALLMRWTPPLIRREAPALAGAALFALGVFWFVSRLAQTA
jgi:hypothetical protein